MRLRLCLRLRRPLALALAIALGLGMPAQAPLAQVRLPSLGESASDDFTPGTERRIGDQIMRAVRRDPAYLDDPVLQEYLQALWQPLVATARQRGDVAPDTDQLFAWESFLVLDRSINAFALPGGFVGVHLGLIAMTASSDELASVLAHELSHVTQRHIARGTVNSARASMIGLATMLLGVLIASRANSSDGANAAMMGGQAAAVQGQLNFSRDMEREADRIGFGVMGGAGFSTAGMAAMFEKMDAANRINDNSAFPYLRSHPLTVERMSEARSRMLLPGTLPPSPPLRHALMRARARVLMDSSDQTLRRLQEQLQPAGNTPLLVERAGALYGGALAASLLGDHARARTGADEAQRLLASASPREPQAERLLDLLQVQLALNRGDAPGALRSLDGLALDGRTRAPMLLRAQAVLDLHRQRGTAAPGPELRDSVEALQTWVAEHKQDAAAWGLLARSAEAAGMTLRALRAEAEARAMVGDLNGAIDRLRAGQQAARGAAGQDFIEVSVIDLRLRELQAQRRQLALEARGERAAPDDRQPPPQ